MSSQSGYAGSAGTNNFSGGLSTWSSTSSATGSPDGAFAACSMLHGSSSQSLDLYNFGLSIPGGATITGLSTTITAKQTSVNGTVEFLDVYISIGGVTGAFTANGLAGTTLTTTSSTYTTGSSTDLAGLTPSVTNCNSNVENTGITLGLVFKNTSGSLTFAADVDAVQITVFYSLAASSFRRKPGISRVGCRIIPAQSAGL